MFARVPPHRSDVSLATSAADRESRRITALGRVRHLTVMFTDITGFTELAEMLPPTLVARLLRGHYRLLARCIESHGGRIDRIMGDGLIAVWERPADDVAPCNSALTAAVEIRSTLRTDNEQRVLRGQPSIRLRVGLHVGPLVATPLGPAGRLGMVLCGDTVNVAQRLEDAARVLHGRHDVSILASDAVVARAGGGFRFDEIGELPVRGRREPVLAFEVVSLEAAAG